jgi:tetratricopeptide (TPR) repeat protein
VKKVIVFVGLVFLAVPLFCEVVKSDALTSKYGVSYAERQKSDYIEKSGYSFRYLENGTWDVRQLSQTTNSGRTGGPASNAANGSDRAIANYIQAIRLSPTYDSSLYVIRGLAYYNKKDYDRAIADYTQAIRLDPNDSWTYNGRGYAYAYKGDYDRALADTNQAIKLSPDDANFYDSRGEVYYMKKDYDRSIADYEYALRLDPNFTNAQEMLAKVRLARGR